MQRGGRAAARPAYSRGSDIPRCQGCRQFRKRKRRGETFCLVHCARNASMRRFIRAIDMAAQRGVCKARNELIWLMMNHPFVPAEAGTQLLSQRACIPLARAWTETTRHNDLIC